MNQHFVAKTLKAVTFDTASPEQKETLKSSQKAVGFIPNMYAKMVYVPGVL